MSARSAREQSSSCVWKRSTLVDLAAALRIDESAQPMFTTYPSQFSFVYKASDNAGRNVGRKSPWVTPVAINSSSSACGSAPRTCQG
jgi:hypothetical protein